MKKEGIKMSRFKEYVDGLMLSKEIEEEEGFIQTTILLKKSVNRRLLYIASQLNKKRHALMRDIIENGIDEIEEILGLKNNEEYAKKVLMGEMDVEKYYREKVKENE